MIKKEIKILDTVTTPLEILQHAAVNFLYGLLNGLVIITMIIGNPLLILGVYYILKQVESKILNRNRYTSNFGKRYLFPIPSTLGFLTGWYIGNIFKGLQ
jgi:hypothetical protein